MVWVVPYAHGKMLLSELRPRIEVLCTVQRLERYAQHPTLRLGVLRASMIQLSLYWVALSYLYSSTVFFFTHTHSERE